jgi:hypothetical protein
LVPLSLRLPAGHYTLEAGDQRGMQALSGTYEGARAAAGSNTAFNLATKDSIGGSTYTNDNDAFGPTAGRPTVFKDGERRSVAFTDIPPNSAAHAGTGYGVVAAAVGEVGWGWGGARRELVALSNKAAFWCCSQMQLSPEP